MSAQLDQWEASPYPRSKTIDGVDTLAYSTDVVPDAPPIKMLRALTAAFVMGSAIWVALFWIGAKLL